MLVVLIAAYISLLCIVFSLDITISLEFSKYLGDICALSEVMWHHVVEEGELNTPGS